MKALVLCAGRGTRLRPLTHTRAKAALPVAGQPVLGHILRYLARHGFVDVGVVISRGQDELRHLRAASPGQRLTFIRQKQPLGIAHAVQSAWEYLENDPFLLYLGDNVTNEDLAPFLGRFREEQPAAMIAVRPVPNPQAFGVAQLDGDRVVRVLEKPANPPGNLAIAGIYLFAPVIHEAARGLQPSARGEYEITDAISRLIQRGHRVIAHRMMGWWQDMGSPEGMLAANRLLLDAIESQVDPDAQLTATVIRGPAVIGLDARLEQVELCGPVLIGHHCQLKRCRIGPYTSIGEGSRVSGLQVVNSVLLPDCQLEGPGDATLCLRDSLLGQNAVVSAETGQTMTLLLGDAGRVTIPSDRR